MLNPADGAFLDHLAGLLQDGVLRPIAPRYLEEPRGRYRGQAAAVACPADADTVAVILRACADARVGVVPYGGGTGLVGGQVAPDGPMPLLLSLERMTALRAVYPSENVLIAEAGVVLADVQAAAEGVERLFPLSLASEGSARIGGLLGANAGGTAVLRYGNARDLCLGLEAVFPDGSIWHGAKRLRKDNTGYDLRHLLIGSEGTLGVITAASLRLYPRPARNGAALMVVNTPADALALLAVAQAQVAEGLSGFELISGMGLRFLREKLPDLRQPFSTPPDWMVLVDLGLPTALDPASALEAIFEAGLDAGLVSDGVIAQSDSQRADFWNLRETIPEANRLTGAIVSHDIALPLSVVPEFLEQADAAIARLGPFRVNCFGHLGDGNLHYNIFPPAGHERATYDSRRAEIQGRVHDLTHAMGGSVSAEHGIGRFKAADLVRYGDPAKLAAMRGIKAALDPVGIMNPGAVLGQSAG
ncbi:FAD-binding oxidoreductase [Roseicitreum antarcticum]|uniref:FAD/FMN-containing dehydrogenase n=1 Tax=Roseicitreum antarcticum TaxID=564137 RepID=A0A1H2XLA0_9RHOB|nr:FAD-binding oxidoreductase [Roseicitreum antarcticum]SDW93652.1 FAD/FMN-containing dehydrogenase [Roseicitreum antarcticum]